MPTNTPNRAAARAGLLADALDCLSFNLHYRALRVADVAVPQEPAQRAALRRGLCRVLMYNVTLRKLILQGTALRGLVRDAGHALALNAQPLLSRLDMSGCGLTEADTRGLQAGLARAWYGGSVACESLAVARNPDVPLTAWDKLWSVLVDPASWSHWPTASPPPPPPRLVNMRHLDVRGTTAAGLGFARCEACSGLSWADRAPASTRVSPRSRSLTRRCVCSSVPSYEARSFRAHCTRTRGRWSACCCTRGSATCARWSGNGRSPFPISAC